MYLQISCLSCVDHSESSPRCAMPSPQTIKLQSRKSIGLPLWYTQHLKMFWAKHLEISTGCPLESETGFNINHFFYSHRNSPSLNAQWLAPYSIPSTTKCQQMIGVVFNEQKWLTKKWTHIIQRKEECLFILSYNVGTEKGSLPDQTLAKLPNVLIRPSLKFLVNSLARMLIS